MHYFILKVIKLHHQQIPYLFAENGKLRAWKNGTALGQMYLCDSPLSHFFKERLIWRY